MARKYLEQDLEFDTFQTNFLFLCSTIGILYVAFLSLYMIAYTLKKNKKLVRETIENHSYVHAETGGYFEDKHVQILSYEEGKSGSCSRALDEYAVNKMVEDPSIKRPEEQKCITQKSGKVLITLDKDGNATGIEEHNYILKEYRKPVGGRQESISAPAVETPSSNNTKSIQGRRETEGKKSPKRVVIKQRQKSKGGKPPKQDETPTPTVDKLPSKELKSTPEVKSEPEVKSKPEVESKPKPDIVVTTEKATLEVRSDGSIVDLTGEAS